MQLQTITSFIASLSPALLAVNILGASFVLAAVVVAILYKRRADEYERKFEKCSEDLSRTSQTMFQKNIELMDANRSLNDMLDTKKIFMDIFAHQLRTPLSAINWSTSALADMVAGNRDGEENISIIQNRINAIRRLADSVLQATELTGGKSAVTRARDESFSAYLSEIARDAEQQFKRADISFTVDIPEQLPPVRINRDFFRVAAENLLENAEWYTPAGGTVRMRAYEQDGNVVIAVEDAGIGIKEDELGRIMQKFYRSERARRTHPDGTGLGLYAVQKIVEMHSGKLNVASKEDAGSTFSIILPVDKQHGASAL